MKFPHTNGTAAIPSIRIALCIGLLFVPVLTACDSSKSTSDDRVGQAEQKCKTEMENRTAAGEFGALENSNEKQAFDDAYSNCVSYYISNG